MYDEAWFFLILDPKTWPFRRPPPTGHFAQNPVGRERLTPLWNSIRAALLGRAQKLDVSIFRINSLGHTKTCQSLQTTASFSPSGRDLPALLGSEWPSNGALALSLSAVPIGPAPSAPLLSVSTPTPPFGFIPLPQLGRWAAQSAQTSRTSSISVARLVRTGSELEPARDRLAHYRASLTHD